MLRSSRFDSIDRLLATVILLGTTGAVAAGTTVDLPRFPSISPDGSTVVFSWRGDLWKVPIAGGTAVRLTSHPAMDGASAWSPDGSLIAFESDRDGFRNIHLMRSDGSDLRQLTHGDLSLSLMSFGVDASGQPVVQVAAAIEGDLYRAPRPYEIPIDGGAPRRIHDAFGTEPVASPDGAQVAFTRGGSAWSRRHYRGSDQRDLWLHDRGDGSFRRLTDWTGNDGRARWLDRDTLIFLSDREGDVVNLHLLRMDGEGNSSTTPLTRFEAQDVLGFDASTDGSTAVLSRWNQLWRLDLRDADAVPEAIEIVAAEDLASPLEVQDLSRDVSECALSPDGKVMAMVAFGDVWVRPIEEGRPARRVTSTLAREQDLAWSPDGLRLYFTSEREGTAGIDRASVVRTRKELRAGYRERTAPRAVEVTEPAGDPATTPSPTEPAAPTDPAAPASDPTPSTPPTTEPPPTEPPPTAPPKVDPPSEPAGAPPTEPASAPAVEPAAASTPPANEATAPPEPPARKDPAFDPTRWQDAVTFEVEGVVLGETEDRGPVPSPDGSRLAFRRGLGDLCVIDLASGEVCSLRPGWDASLGVAWSPDSKWLAYSVSDPDFNADVHVMPADGSSPAVNVTRHPDLDVQPRFSADGKVLAFISDRTADERDAWMVFLDRDLEQLSRRDLDAYFDQASKEAKKRKPLPPVGAPEDPKKAEKGGPKKDSAAEGESGGDLPELEPGFTVEDLEDAWRRLRRVTSITGDEGGLGLLPGGDRLIFSASGGPSEGRGLYSIKWDGTDLKRIGAAADLQGISLDGATLSLVQGGQARTMPSAGGTMTTIELPERIEVDRAAKNLVLFDEAARILGEGFYLDPAEKGLDWSSLTARYRELAAASRTPEELEWVTNLLFGELNGSHLGMRARDSSEPLRPPQGRLGTVLEPVEGGFRVAEVLPNSPAERSPTPLVVGDVIVAVEFAPLEPGDTVERRLRGRIGRETALTVRRTRSDGEAVEIDCLVVPVSAEALRDLLYEETSRRAARLVDEWSDGRIGYAHIRSMDTASLEQFEGDLFAAAEGRDGLIIDVRNNGGGSTADRLLSSIMVQPHAYTVPRGGDPAIRDGYPRDRLFIQRYELPINMLCNEKSFSNAEIISHAFKTLKRGTLVGMPTYGGVISTGSHRLLDGSTIRMPFRGWYLPDGTDMENHGAVPDLQIPQTPEDEVEEFDRQLKVAVEDLLRRLDVG